VGNGVLPHQTAKTIKKRIINMLCQCQLKLTDNGHIGIGEVPTLNKRSGEPSAWAVFSNLASGLPVRKSIARIAGQWL
jgi:hypothetical protein